MNTTIGTRVAIVGAIVLAIAVGYCHVARPYQLRPGATDAEVQRGTRSAARIVPELQRFRVGDSVPISLVATMQFAAIEPGRYLIWSGRSGGTNGAFTWALYPVDAAHTRLVSRIRWTHHWSQPGLLVLDLFSD